jgi:hypothetical protein
MPCVREPRSCPAPGVQCGIATAEVPPMAPYCAGIMEEGTPQLFPAPSKGWIKGQAGEHRNLGTRRRRAEPDPTPEHWPALVLAVQERPETRTHAAAGHLRLPSVGEGGEQTERAQHWADPANMRSGLHSGGAVRVGRRVAA